MGTNIKYIKAKDISKSSVEYTFQNTEHFTQNVLNELQHKNCISQISVHYCKLNSDKNLSLHRLINQFVRTGETEVEDFLNFCKDNMSEDECKLVADNTKKQSESTLWIEMRYCRIKASKIYEMAYC